MRTIALPVNLLSEGSRQKISDFGPWLLRSGKAYQTILSYLYAARQFLSLYPDVTHDNLLLYKCYLDQALQTAHRKSEDPGDQLFYGISRDPRFKTPHGTAPTATISRECDQSG